MSSLGHYFLKCTPLSSCFIWKNLSRLYTPLTQLSDKRNTWPTEEAHSGWGEGGGSGEMSVTTALQWEGWRAHLKEELMTNIFSGLQWQGPRSYFQSVCSRRSRRILWSTWARKNLMLHLRENLLLLTSKDGKAKAKQ